MTRAADPKLDEDLKRRLGISLRRPPELYERSDDLESSGHADAIRVGLDQLGLSAVFCVQGVPTAALLRTKQYHPETTMRLHAALWNQGLANVLVIIDEDLVIRVFSLGRAPIKGSIAEFEARTLISMIAAAADAASAESLLTGLESGRFINENEEFFHANERVDSILLDNLLEYSLTLQRTGLTQSTSHALLLQTMFVAYLEDRKILTEAYISSATGRKHATFHDILANADQRALVRLFRNLARDFNGDLFIAPSAFPDAREAPSFDTDALRNLAEFREGRLHRSTGQWRFWGYDFRYIPVELISAVYDRFISEEEGRRRELGSYFTPMFLVDASVSSIWDQIDEDYLDNATFLDPACGSGIFLVAIFQRLCARWRAHHRNQVIPWPTLVRFVRRLNGWDVNAGAVRVALFSLYLALLEEVTPPDLQILIESHDGLPSLLPSNLQVRDFFDENFADQKFDIVIGNPPWTSRRGAARQSITWSQKNDFPAPTREDAWAFVWKSDQHLTNRGIVAFLLPAMGFLHNTSPTTTVARRRLFTRFRVLQILNFSDLRFLLFEGAVRPAALIIFRRKEPQCTEYNFDYWFPKADLNAQLRRVITLSTIDRTSIRSRDAVEDPLVFKQRASMKEPEARLFRYLSSLPRLGRTAIPYKTAPGYQPQSDRTWVIGQGYQPALGDRVRQARYIPKQSEYVGSVPDLPISHFTRFWQHAHDLPRREDNRVRRRGFEEGFTGPRIIIPRGVNTSLRRLRAAFTDEPFTVQDIFQVISVPAEDVERAKLFTAILNSKLAVWFAFYGTASFGSERPEVKAGELLNFPFPSPADVSDPKRSQTAAAALISIIDTAEASSEMFLLGGPAENDFLPVIDKLVYDYYSLSPNEALLIEEGVDFIIASSQPSRRSPRPTWRMATQSDRKAYAETLMEALSRWFSNDTSFFATLEAANNDVAVLSVRLTESRAKTLYFESGLEPLSKMLDWLSQRTTIAVSGNVQVTPDIRLFIDQCVYLVKPTQLRFWLRSQALADADAIATDIQTSIAMQGLDVERTA
jgi:hypothetical protein